MSSWPTQQNAGMLRKKKKFKRSDGAKERQLPDCEWNFDEGRVPGDELVACCYWEYARESDFIRRVVRRLKEVDSRKGVTKTLETPGKPWAQTRCLRLLEEAGAKVEFPALRWGSQHDYTRYYKQMLEEAQAELVPDNLDLTRLYSIGTPVEFFRRLPFPKRWQSLTPAQRSTGKDFVAEIPTPEKIPPFRVTGDLLIASVLQGEATKAYNARQALFLRLSQIDRGAAGLKEAAELRKKLSEKENDPAPVLVRGEGGVDSFVAQINWREFTDNEIIACFERWVKAKGTRPPNPKTDKLVGRRSNKGRDMGEWRAKLENLGLLRLRCRHTLDETLAILARLLPAQRKKTKFVEPGECNREAEKTLAAFHAFFPFLNPTEMPRSWRMN